MKRRPAATKSWLPVALIVAAAVLWVIDLQRNAGQAPKPSSARVENPNPSSPPRSSEKPAATPETAGPYEVYQKCTLVKARNNDGDSFMLHLPDGRKAEFRLYFVDTPESAFKRYAGGETNYERIRRQAADLGGITPEQAVEIGKKAKAFTLGLLESEPFTVFTCWDSPFHDNRFHAFVQIGDQGKSRWLHELLIERGLARIITKPADLPDGSPASRQRDHLRELERSAKHNASGVWAL